MTSREVATDHYHDRAKLVDTTAEAATEAWQSVSPGRLNADWPEAAARLSVVVSGAQLTAARAADPYAAAVLREQGLSSRAQGVLQPATLAGIASDGRDLVSLIGLPAGTVAGLLADGTDLERAVAAGLTLLDLIVRTQVADAGRAADSVAAATRPDASGYIRMTAGPTTCSRCAVLAGRWYAWNADFDRHPQDDCIQIPGREDTTGDLRTDPRKLIEAGRVRGLSKDDLEAIKAGADPAQVINAKRGMRTATVFGRDLRITLEGTTRRGLAGQRLIAEGARLSGETAETVRRNARTGVVERTVTRQRVQIPRLMPEEIFRAAKGDRNEAVRLLRRFGYIL